MRIGLQTWGTEGDVRPFFALAQAIKARGHTVRLHYTNVDGRSFDALGAACGIESHHIAGDYFSARQGEFAARMASVFAISNPLRQIRGILEAGMDPIVDVMFDSAAELAKGCDAVVGHFMTSAVGAAAKMHDRPYAMVAFAPVFPSANYAPIGTPDLGRLLNPLLWRIVAQVLESVMKDRVNHTRRRASLPELSNLLAVTVDQIVLAITAVSPTLFPRPDDWHPRYQVSGFLGIPVATDAWEPSPELASFLAAGPPPAFLSFGSMLNIADQRTFEAVRTFTEALGLAKARGIIQAPAEVSRTFPASEHVHFLTRAPHAILFPKCQVIVHHGGAGTTQAATLAGRPSIVVPHVADQFFWGERLEALGLAPRSLPRKKLTAARLAERLRTAMGDAPMHERAEAVAGSLRAEDGPARGAELLEQAFLAHRAAR